MRILHFSDIHVGLGLRAIPVSDWPGKRIAGGVNLLRGRGRKFASAGTKLEALARFRQRAGVDVVLCSGDLTSLGTNRELEAARDLLDPVVEGTEFVAVPGNHDLYTPSTVRQSRFQAWFEPALVTDVPDLRSDGPWPLIRLLDDHSVVVAVNSARPTRAPWRSSGRVPAAQVAGLRHALDDPRLADRFVFLMTHYAPCRADGSEDHPSHGLRNVDEVLEAASGVRRGAFLCGHIHTTFRVELPGFAGEVFCAGSATIDGREGFWMFDRIDGGWTARRGRWGEGAWALDEEARPVAEGHGAEGRRT